MDFDRTRDRGRLEGQGSERFNWSRDLTLEEESTCENQDFGKGGSLKSPVGGTAASKCRNRVDCNQTISTIFELRLKLCKLEEGVSRNKKQICELEQEHLDLTSKKEVLRHKVKAKLKMMKQPKNFCCNFSNLFS